MFWKERTENAGDTIKKSKAKKLANYGRPNTCPYCSKSIIPKLHPQIIEERFSLTEICKCYEDECEHCYKRFKYWK